PPTILSYYSSCYHRDVHSFPTRRSSDLIKEHVQVKGISCLESRNIKFVPQKIKGRQHVLHIIFNSKGLFGAVFLVMNVSSPCGMIKIDLNILGVAGLIVLPDEAVRGARTPAS